MNKNKGNRIDSMIDQLIENFSKIKNFNLLIESEEGKKVFEFIVKSTSEIESFQTLFLNYYIPASNKAIADGWKDIKKSKYKDVLGIKQEDLKENLYETIRLGYVGLFHKYESYLKSLVEAVNYLIGELFEDDQFIPIEKYCQKEFGTHLLKSHNLFYSTKRISYINNCVKHYDGYPIKEPIHEDFTHLAKDKKIQITPDSFKSDIKLLKGHCELILSQTLFLGIKQLFTQDMFSKDMSDEDFDKLNELQNNMDLILADFKK